MQAEGFRLNNSVEGKLMPKFETRGPDPDGDWFVFAIEQDGSERAIDETFPGEVDAQAVADKLNGNQQGAEENT